MKRTVLVHLNIEMDLEGTVNGRDPSADVAYFDMAAEDLVSDYLAEAGLLDAVVLMEVIG